MSDALSPAAAIRAVFFDLDDTLCDAKPAFARASPGGRFDAIRVRHPYLTDVQVREGWQNVHGPLLADLAAGGVSMSEVRLLRFRHLLTQLGVPDAAFADEVDLLLGRVQLEVIVLFQSALDTLAELRRRGFYVGIITNGSSDTHPDSQRSKAIHLGLLDRVDSFWVSDEMGYRKPDPRAFLPALRAANCKPGEAIYVGDSLENDVTGANNAGLVSILFLRSDSDKVQKAADIQPHYTVASLRQVADMLAEVVISHATQRKII